MIWDKAQELGRQIGQSAEYQALRRAESTLREDKETVTKLDQIQTLARKVDQAIAQGQMPDQPTSDAYEAAVRDLETSSVGQAYVVARANFEKLMARVNQQITEGIQRAPRARSSRWDDARPRQADRPPGGRGRGSEYDPDPSPSTRRSPRGGLIRIVTVREPGGTLAVGDSIRRVLLDPGPPELSPRAGLPVLPWASRAELTGLA